MANIDHTRPFIAVGIAVLTVSDTRVAEDDKSGNTLARLIEEAGHTLVARAIVKDELAAIGLGEERGHITNIVYWRPPGNRTPTPQEAQVCRPFLERQIELVAPELLGLLGGVAAKHVLGVNDGIMRLRGRLREVAILGRTLRVVATLHPAYLLRTPAAKRLAWRDLLLIKATLAAAPGGHG